MSQYATPFLVLNLGSEMIFVIAQRLQAQSVPVDRANLVLDEILSVLISAPLTSEMIKPQTTYTHDSVRAVIEDVTQCSIMRLDNHSMDRLWDLITMVFKWQVTFSSDIMALTMRHLYEIETYSLNPKTHLQLHKVQNIIENFNKIFNQNDQNQIREDVLAWLHGYNIRVSLLLRMGLQNNDGSFVCNNSNPIAQEMLKNLGENIYAVTQNGRVLENDNGKTENKEDQASVERIEKIQELQTFVNQMLGGTGRRASGEGGGGGPTLKLVIENSNNVDKRDEDIKVEIFDNIDATSRDSKLQKIFNDLNLGEDLDNRQSIQDDLLDIIGKESDAL